MGKKIVLGGLMLFIFFLMVGGLRAEAGLINQAPTIRISNATGNVEKEK